MVHYIIHDAVNILKYAALPDAHCINMQLKYLVCEEHDAPYDSYYESLVCSAT